MYDLSINTVYPGFESLPLRQRRLPVETESILVSTGLKYRRSNYEKRDCYYKDRDIQKARDP